MVNIHAVRTRHARGQTPATMQAVRAEALFVSPLQPSDAAAPDEVRRAVVTTMRRLGVAGCAAQMATDFGDHPDTAPARMTWALAAVRTVYASTPVPAHTRRPPARSAHPVAS
ncbi:MAG: hypothetical protein QOE76_2650 [Frankiales bacterium]|nr:hypothetical protein [Frankiales bacterium]